MVPLTRSLARTVVVVMAMITIVGSAPISTPLPNTVGLSNTIHSFTSSRSMSSTDLHSLLSTTETSTVKPRTTTTSQHAPTGTTSTTEGSRSTAAGSRVAAQPNQTSSERVSSSKTAHHSGANAKATTTRPKSVKLNSTRTHSSKSKTTKANVHRTTKAPAAHTSHTKVPHSSKPHTPQASHTHSSHHPLPTPANRHRGGGKTIVSDPIPGSEWERIRKILLIPLSVITVLTFLGGIALYITATWGAGEGWFGRPVREVVEEKGKTIGSAPQRVEERFAGDVKQERIEKDGEAKEEGRREASQVFRYRVPSIDTNVVAAGTRS